MAMLPMNFIRSSLFFGALTLAASAIAEDAEKALQSSEINPLSEPQIAFVADQFYVPLRSSPCATCKIVHKGLKSGTRLSILGHQENWSLVTTDSGYSGWMRSQHITLNQIARVKLAISQQQVAEIERKNKRLEEDMQNSFELIETLRKNIAVLETDRKALSKELASLKLISSKEIALDQQNQLLVKHNHMLQEERDVLRANVDDLENEQRNESFLYGGFVTFLGAILAALIPRLRGRRRLSEWR